MSDLTMDAILADCELTTVDLIVPPSTKEHASESFLKVFTFLKALREDVRKKDEADKKAEGPKVDPPHVKKWKADKKAEKLAKDLAAGIVKNLEQYEGNAALLFHLKDALRESVVKYVSNEVEYEEWKAERAETPAINKNVAKGSTAVNAERYKVGKAGLENLWNISGHNLTLPTGTLKADKGSMVPNLDSLPGNYGGNGAASSGRYAPLYRINYTVDGKRFGDPRDALRAIWTGSQRVGKNTADLWTLLESKKVNPAAITDPVTINENGRTIVVTKKEG